MGIYSQNRIAGIAGDVTLESMDFTPDFSIGCALEAAIQMHENDARMFDTLIECDFMEAENAFVMNESEVYTIMEAANESKFKNIVNKIKEAFDKFVIFIQKCAGNMIAKFVDITKSDRKIINQYADVLKVENLKNFKGIMGFKPPKFMLSDKSFIDFAKYREKILEFKELCESAATKEEQDALGSHFEKLKEYINDEFNKNLNIQFSVTSNVAEQNGWKFTSDHQIDVYMKMLLEAKSVIKQVKGECKETLKVAKLFQNTFAKENFYSKFRKPENRSKVAVNAYRAGSSLIRHMSNKFTQLNNSLKEEYASIRKAIILCGRAAAKEAKGEDEKVEESVEMMNYENAVAFAIAEASDAFVNEYFDYAY